MEIKENNDKNPEKNGKNTKIGQRSLLWWGFTILIRGLAIFIAAGFLKYDVNIKCVVVRVYHLNRCKTSNFAGGHRGPALSHVFLRSPLSR